MRQINFMQEFSLYFSLGWQHILDWSGYDHILFVAVLCGVYLLRDWKQVLILVTAFTIGHSITLALSVFNLVRINTDLIEFLIPVTIVVTALVNILNKKYNRQLIWISYSFAMFFGLIHGLGFSNFLKSVLGKEEHITTPLFAFNIGLEFGQLLIVLGILLISSLLMNFFKVPRREWNLFLSSGVFGIALVMAIERF